jgi:hypothetical protein
MGAMTETKPTKESKEVKETKESKETQETQETKESKGMKEIKDIPYYAQDVDFDRLAQSSPDFAKVIAPGKKKGFIDFQDVEVVK